MTAQYGKTKTKHMKLTRQFNRDNAVTDQYQGTDIDAKADINSRDERITALEEFIEDAKQGAPWLAVIITAVLFLGAFGFIAYTAKTRIAETVQAGAIAVENVKKSAEADIKTKNDELAKINADLSAAKTATVNAEKLATETRQKLTDAEKSAKELTEKLAAVNTAKSETERKLGDSEKALTEIRQKLTDADKKLAEVSKTPPIDVNEAIAKAVAQVKSELARIPVPAVTPNVVVNPPVIVTGGATPTVVAKHSPDVLRRILARSASASSSVVRPLIEKLLSGTFSPDSAGASILEEASAQALRVASDVNRDASTRNYAAEDAAALKGAAEALRAGSGGRVISARQPLPPIVADGQPKKK